MILYKPIKVSHPAISGYHRHSRSKDIWGFFCRVTLQEHVIKALRDFMIGGLSRYVIILPSLMAIGTVVIADIMVLVCQ